MVTKHAVQPPFRGLLPLDGGGTRHPAVRPTAGLTAIGWRQPRRRDRLRLSPGTGYNSRRSWWEKRPHARRCRRRNRPESLRPDTTRRKDVVVTHR